MIKLDYEGNGGKLFGRLFVGFLLMVITLGIYSPWFYCRLIKDVFEDTTMQGSRKGPLKFEFTGSGGEYFGIVILGYILCFLTLGIYAFWMMAKIISFHVDHASAKASDGTVYRLKFHGTGGSILGAMLVGYLLTFITLGIYGPWFMCSFQKLIMSNIEVLENEQPIGKVDFQGQGAELFGKFIVGYILLFLTLGLYRYWFEVTMLEFMIRGTRVQIGGQTLVGQFTGTGGQNFGINFVGGLLTCLTLGIYFFWFIVKWIEFRVDNTSFVPAGAAGVVG